MSLATMTRAVKAAIEKMPDRRAMPLSKRQAIISAIMNRGNDLTVRMSNGEPYDHMAADSDDQANGLTREPIPYAEMSFDGKAFVSRMNTEPMRSILARAADAAEIARLMS